MVDEAMTPLWHGAGGQAEASWHTGAGLGSTRAFRQWPFTVQGGEKQFIPSGRTSEHFF